MASNSNYAVIAGGCPSLGTYVYSNKVEALDENLTHYTEITALSIAREESTPCSSEMNAIFAGGMNSPGSVSRVRNVDAYDNNLTRRTGNLVFGLYSQGSAYLNGMSIFAGGIDSSNKRWATSNAYDDYITNQSSGGLMVARNALGGAANSEYAFFAGGYDGSSLRNTVDIHDKNLTLKSGTAIGASASGISGVRAGDYALFTLGSSNMGVNAYDTSCTRSILASLSAARNFIPTVTIHDYAVMMGGNNCDVVEQYDPKLTKKELTPMSFKGRSEWNAAAKAGDYLVVINGTNMDIYQFEE